jgi:hypothetical protein
MTSQPPTEPTAKPNPGQATEPNPQAYGEQPSGQARKRAWTVLAYVMADDTGAVGETDEDNLIDRVAEEEVGKLIAAARGRDNVHLAVQADFTGRPGTLRVRPGRLPETLPETTAGLEGFTAFAREMCAECPADHYMVIVWGHGAGPLGFFSDGDGTATAGRRSGSLSLTDLGTALRNIAWQRGKDLVDILLVKSCYAATLEAAFELQDAVRFMVSSQAKVPLRTWTIWEVFDALNHPTTDVEATAGQFLNALSRHFDSAIERRFRKEVPFSLVKVANAGAAAKPLERLASMLAERGLDDASRVAIHTARPTRAGDMALLDVVTLCQALKETKELANAANDLASAIRTAVVATQPDDSVFTGLGLFHLPEPLLRLESFANDVTLGSYGRLRLDQATGWSRVAFSAD